jgi:hypothetical protein
MEQAADPGVMPAIEKRLGVVVLDVIEGNSLFQAYARRS